MRGFTYIGLLLAVALTGVFLAAAGELWSTIVQREREARLVAIGLEFQRALQSYYDASPGVKVAPTRLEDLLEDRRLPVTRRHLRRLYHDPMTGSTQWGLIRAGDRIVGVHSLSGAVPLRVMGDRTGKREPTTYRDWVFRISAEAPEVDRAGGAAAQGKLPVAPLGSPAAAPSGGPITSAAGANPVPRPPDSEEVAKRRACSDRFSAERQQCLGMASGERAAFGRCMASASGRMTACFDGVEAPPLVTQ